MDPLLLADAAQHATRARLLGYVGAAGVEVRRGAGWTAVRTGVQSNDLNGVVDDGAPVSAGLAADLVSWFAATPASWWTEQADPHLTRTLVAAGARPERSGQWSGRRMPVTVTPSTSWSVVRVDSSARLEDWLDLAVTCGWVDTAADRSARQRLYGSLPDDGPLTHWLALEDGVPVGFASSFVDATVLDLCNLAVLEPWRRRGVGRALVEARLAHAAARGAEVVVSGPSHDGWQLQRALGFLSVAVVPDTCFYLPYAGGPSGAATDGAGGP